MKKFYLALFAFIGIVGAANSQCTINASAQTTPGANPSAADLPCIVQSVPYDQTVQGKIQDSQDTTLGGIAQVHIVVDSVRLDSITGIPNGISWVKNPDVLPGGGNGCVRFQGTTTDAVGTYPLTAYGTAWFTIHVTSPITFDTTYTYSGNLNQYSPFGNYYLRVVAQAADCASGISAINNELNSLINVYPNPNNGQFEFKLDAGTRVNGDLVVVDMTGKMVYSQKLDVVGYYNTSINLSGLPRGIYSVQLRTAEGNASRNISVE